MAASHSGNYQELNDLSIRDSIDDGGETNHLPGAFEA
jgi:hypothetical protein